MHQVLKRRVQGRKSIKQHAADRGKLAVRAAIEALEERKLLTVTAGLSSGVLTVVLGGQSDTVTVGGSGQSVQSVQITGTGFTTYTFSNVSALNIEYENSLQNVYFSSTESLNLPGALTVSSAANCTNNSLDITAASTVSFGSVSIFAVAEGGDSDNVDINTNTTLHSAANVVIGDGSPSDAIAVLNAGSITTGGQVNIAAGGEVNNTPYGYNLVDQGPISAASVVLSALPLSYVRTSASAPVETTGGPITITTDDLSLNAPVDTTDGGTYASAGVTIDPATTSTPLILGSAGIPTTNFSQITASVLNIGSTTASPEAIEIENNLAGTNGWDTLSLIGGQITQAGNAALQLNTLLVSASSSVSLTDANNLIQDLGGTSAGTFTVSDSGGLLSFTGGGVTAGGSINISAFSNLLINEPIVATGSGRITLSSGGEIFENSFGSISGGLLTTNSVTGTTLSGANSVSSFNASTGHENIVLANDAALLTVTGASTPGVGSINIQNVGAMTIVGVVGGAGGVGAITLSATGAMTIDQSQGAFVYTASGAVTLSAGSAGVTLIAAATPSAFLTGDGVNLPSEPLNIVLTAAPTPGQTIEVADNMASTRINGTFSNLADGGSIAATYNSIPYTFTANYEGGTGNDLVLTYAQPNLSVAATDSDGGSSITHSIGTATPDTGITYTLTVSNTGNGAAQNVLVSDTLPTQGLSNVTAATLPPGVTFNAATDTFNISNLAAGATEFLNLTGIIPSSATGTYTNSISASAANAAAVSALVQDNLTLAGSLVVTTTDDNDNSAGYLSNDNSLRDAIAYAESLNTPATITFDPTVFKNPQTITLGGTQLELTNANTNPITIDASSVGGVTIDGRVNGNFGNGIFQVDSGATASFTDLTIINGHAGVINGDAGFGGGIYNDGTLTVTDCTLSNDSADAGGGGGIYSDGTLTVIDSTLSNDSAKVNGNGGGIENDYGTLLVTGSTLANDSAVGFGGGIGNVLGTLTITNSTLTNDSSETRGGGIASAGGTPTITDSTFNNNSTNGKGPDFFGVNFTAYNSIFADDIYIIGGISGSNNLVGTAAAQGLGTLGYYGGPTETIPLLPGSPAIGAGVPIAGVTTDQTGYTRSATAPSIGAYENEGFTITAGGSGQTTVPSTAFATPLGVKVSSNNPLLTNLSGGVITFTAPATGASATFGTNPITLAADGTGSTIATANATPGSYNVTATASGITNSATFGLTNAKLTPTITVTDNTGVFNGLPFNATSTVNGTSNPAVVYSYFLASDTSFQHQLSGAPTNVGNYLVIAVYNGNSTYNANGASVYFNITPAPSKITAADLGGTYNGSPFGATGTVTGVGGLSVTPTFTYVGTGTTVYAASTTAPTNAGTYTVTASYAGDANHTGGSIAAIPFTIAQAAPTLSVTDTGGVYNATPYNATGTSSIGAPYYEYFLQSDTAFKNPSTTAPTNVGSYVVIGFTPVNSNYMQAGKAVYFSITQAASVLTPAAATLGYGGSTALSTTLKTTGGALLAGRTVSFTVNGKVVGTAVTNASGVATLTTSFAGITPGSYSSGIGVSFAGDSNSTAISATAALVVQDAPIVSSVTASGLGNIGSVLGSFTQARTGAAASDFIATVNWGDGTTQQLSLVADLLHPGQFDLLGATHLYASLFKSYTVTVTISTVAKFGAAAGATTTYTNTITA